MSTKLLKAFITSVLSERIRSTSSTSTTSFKLNEFKKLQTTDDCIEYAKKRLKLLGEGSSRIVFILSSKKVLKIAKGKPKKEYEYWNVEQPVDSLDEPTICAYCGSEDIMVSRSGKEIHCNTCFKINDKYTGKGDDPALEAGLNQNLTEIQVWNNTETRNVVSQIYEHDIENKWLISDLVKEFRYAHQMKIALNIKENVAIGSFIQDVINSSNRFVFNNDIDSNISDEKREYLNDFIDSLRSIVSKFNLISGDLHYKHFGKTREGRVVLFDYGATEEIIDKFY